MAGRTTGTKVRTARDPQPYWRLPAITQTQGMAQRNERVLLTTGLAGMEGENARYTRASDNFR